MKIQQIREWNASERNLKLAELQQKLFESKIKVQTKQLENTSTLSALRKDIARIKTVMREAGLQSAPAAEPQGKAKE
jgi:large subunit ribosomal protein L29